MFRLWIVEDFVKAREDGKKSEFSENKYRRISIYGSMETIPKSIKLNSGVRSIFLFSFNDELINMSSLSTLFQNFKLLKVLDFQFAPLDNLPKKVGNLFHLRVKIQNGFRYLENLETLEDLEVHLDWVVFAKEQEKLSKLTRLGVSNLSEESSRAISAAAKKLNHLEHLS
ncbi:LRR domain containing protein [Parasponia andersonii]|uniref:LRR domain containing protein n=1 Tax=Parasponia andersonii TaxID=3476 RepID=A0A2P5CN88_PARAD|nr:LRR domain containing protein [Parasponia andersonii]